MGLQVKDNKFFTVRKMKKLLRNPKLFFIDSYNKRFSKTHKMLPVLNVSTKNSNITSNRYSKEDISSPVSFANKFINDTKQMYQLKYDGDIYPLLNERVFKANEESLQGFWNPLLDSDLGKGLKIEKNNTIVRHFSKVNSCKTGKIKVAVLSENFHFMKPLYQSEIVKQYIEFREVSFTEISRGFSAQHRKFPSLDHLHTHGQLVGRGESASDIDKVFSSFARFFPENYETIQWADIVWAEWWVHPTVWASRFLPDNTKLITRCHAYEAFTYWPHFIDFERIDKNIFVGEHIKEIALESFENFRDFDDTNNHLIRNYIDFSNFETSKTFNARFHIGMVQWGDSNKNPLLALQVLEKLVSIDSRFKMKFAGLPFNKPTNEIEEAYQKLFEGKAAQLSSNIEFSGFVDDMNVWYKDVGFVINCSNRESQSVSVCEGAATGAIPVIKEWSMLDKFEAASKIYPGYVYSDVDSMVQSILRDNENFDRVRSNIIHKFREDFGLEKTAKQTLNLILETMNR